MDRPVKPSPGEVLRDFSRALATAGTSMVDDSVTAVPATWGMVHANRAQSLVCLLPGEDPGPNWLAAPPAPFGLTLRPFSPEDSFFDGRYTVPPVARVKP